MIEINSHDLTKISALTFFAQKPTKAIGNAPPGNAKTFVNCVVNCGTALNS